MGISVGEYLDYFRVGRPVSRRWYHSLCQDPELGKTGASRLNMCVHAFSALCFLSMDAMSSDVMSSHLCDVPKMMGYNLEL